MSGNVTRPRTVPYPHALIRETIPLDEFALNDGEVIGTIDFTAQTPSSSVEVDASFLHVPVAGGYSQVEGGSIHHQCTRNVAPGRVAPISESEQGQAHPIGGTRVISGAN